jgi:DNA polymerase
MIIVTIDFESAYGRHPVTKENITLSSMTTEEYIRHPLFKVHGVGIKHGPMPTVWHGADEVADALATIPWGQTICIAHHAQFDGAILNWIYGYRPKMWVCTMSMGAFRFPQESSSLANLSKLCGCGEKGIELALTKNLWELPDHIEQALGGYCINDVDLTYKLFQQMKLGFPVDELKLIDLTVRMFTEPKLHVDVPLLQQEAERIETAKLEALARIHEMTGGDLKALRSNPQFAALLRAQGVEPPMKLSPTTGQPTYAFAKTDEGFLDLQEHESPIVRMLVASRLQLKTSIDETRTQRYIGMGRRGSFPVYLRYFGARNTGRYSAGDKQNTQNMRKGSALRKAILAPPGYDMMASDLSQIEARMLAWLAGQHDLVQLFAAGADIYCAFGSKVYGRTITKEDKLERQASKAAILGQGFGMGWVRFAAFVLRGTPPIRFGVADLEQLGLSVRDTLAQDIQTRMSDVSSIVPANELAIHCACAKEVNRRYREINDKIVKYWKTGELMLADMIRGRRVVYGPVTTGPCSLTFPNGVTLQYPQLEESGSGRGYRYKGRNGWETLTGPKLVENIVQGLSRCIMTWQMLNIAVRYPVVLSVHDEIVCLCPKEDEGALDWLVGQMHIGPAWAAGLPLAAEGHRGQNYGDCK